MDSIKPPGSGRPYLEPPKDTRPSSGVAKGGERSGFDAVSETSRAQAGGAAAAPGLAGVVGQYRKADLKDPDKLEAMIQGSVKELIDLGLGGQASLSDTQKAQIGDFIGSDPIMRRQIEKYLERMLP